MRIFMLAALAATPGYAAEPVAIGDRSDAEAQWADLYKSSFSGGEEPASASDPAQDGGDEPLLVTGASLPVRLVFGQPPVTWAEQELPAQLGEDRRATLALEVEGCKLRLSTGPLQVASYDLLAGQPAVVSDSLPARSELKAPVGGALYVSASAELVVELAPHAERKLCARRLAGRLVPLGRFGFDESHVAVAAPEGGGEGQVDGVTDGLAQEVFLMWPAGQDAPLLLDAMGPHPQIETGVRRVRASAAADLFLDIVPQLERVGEVRDGAQRAAGLQALWGDLKR